MFPNTVVRIGGRGSRICSASVDPQEQGCGKMMCFSRLFHLLRGLSRQKFNSDLEERRWQSLASYWPPAPGTESEPCHYKLYDFREESSCY